jgi:16S rRNA (uracil1498-N3)-methyltransferase
MSLRRVFVQNLTGPRVAVEGEKARHLSRVIRLCRGEVVEVSDSRRVFVAAVSRSSSSLVEFELREERTPQPESARLTLALAVFKFARLEWVLEKAAELGAGAIVPVAAARSDPRLVEAAVRRRERWQRIADEASSQARRLGPPEVAPPCGLSQFLARPCAGFRLFLDIDAPLMREVLAERPRPESGVVEATLLVGPEGGWNDAERESAIQAGFRPVGLGNNILRAETAAIAALAVLCHSLERFQPVRLAETTLPRSKKGTAPAAPFPKTSL